jgi:hypothetical protein
MWANDLTIVPIRYGGHFPFRNRIQTSSLILLAEHTPAIATDHSERAPARIYTVLQSKAFNLNADLLIWRPESGLAIGNPEVETIPACGTIARKKSLGQEMCGPISYLSWTGAINPLILSCLI